MGYELKKDGKKYEMGASIDEVGKGDVIKVGPGRLEIISDISSQSVNSWNRTITTESGRTVDMLGVHAYGKKKE